jgi:hypothetical protein
MPTTKRIHPVKLVTLCTGLEGQGRSGVIVGMSIGSVSMGSSNPRQRRVRSSAQTELLIALLL